MYSLKGSTESLFYTCKVTGKLKPITEQPVQYNNLTNYSVNVASLSAICSSHKIIRKSLPESNLIKKPKNIYQLFIADCYKPPVILSEPIPPKRLC